MSRFSEKIFRGEAPTPAEWREHLLEVHRHAPSMTPQAFAAHKTADGIDSYALLAGDLQPTPASPVTVLDLACGDGHLIPLLLERMPGDGTAIGVDMSDAELAAARRTIADPRVRLVQASAQSLPVGDESIDHVFCHLAFMLMTPIEPVVSELARVIKPGGRFSAIVDDPRRGEGLWGEIMETTYRHVVGRYPAARQASSGDLRVHSEQGIESLFRQEQGFAGRRRSSMSI
jgi:ubiquinone/menaquinone biosynthesis C-methylase UbiE